jgi:uncharacterized protein (DUF1786 family)
MTESRRSLRLIASVPVNLTAGRNRAVQARTAAVSRHGALVFSPVGYTVGTLLEIQNAVNLVATACRVVWVSRDDLRNIHKLGVEFVDDAPTFWGAAYEERLALGLEQGDQGNSGTAEETTKFSRH